MQSNLENKNSNIKYKDREISISEIFFLFKKYRKLIFFICVGSVLLSMFYSFLLKPVYKSKGMIMIDDPSSTMDIFNSGMTVEKKYLENEIEILKSRTTAERTVKALLDSSIRNNLYLFGTRKYKSNKIRSWIVNLIKFGIPDKIIKIPDLENDISDSLINIYTDRLKKSISVSNQRNTDMLTVSVKSNDPYEASLIVNTFIEVYREIDLEWTTGEVSHLKTFLINQIRIKEKELSESEKFLKDFQEKEKIFGVDDKSDLLLQNLISSESNLYKIKSEINISNERKKYLESKLSIEEKQLADRVTSTIQDRLFALKDEIAVKETELVAIITQQGDEHDRVNKLKEKISKLKQKLESDTKDLISQGITSANPIQYRQTLMDSLININAVTAMLESKADEMEKLVDNYEEKLSFLPTKILDYTRLKRNLSIQTETYSLMRQKLEEAKINQASQVGKVRTVDIARPNLEKIEPKMDFALIIGFLIGLFSSILSIFILEYFNHTVKSIEEIDNIGLSILAIIPSMGIVDSKRKKKTKKYMEKLGNAEKIERRLVLHEDPKSPISEAFRSLRTGLMYSQDDQDNSNVILISSPGPGEGKTTTIVNLAITYANLGKKTILLDTDLRKPVVHKIFSAPRDKGMTSYLTGITDNHNDIILNTEIKNLSIVPSGIIPPNPSEILASKHMADLIEKLRNDYDVILLDSPPLLAVTDSFVSLKHVDQFALVVRMGKTEKGGLARSIDQINHGNVNISGLILNDVNESSSYGTGYYYNYYQYYYGEQS